MTRNFSHERPAVGLLGKPVWIEAEQAVGRIVTVIKDIDGKPARAVARVRHDRWYEFSLDDVTPLGSA